MCVFVYYWWPYAVRTQTAITMKNASGERKKWRGLEWRVCDVGWPIIYTHKTHTHTPHMYNITPKHKSCWETRETSGAKPRAVLFRQAKYTHGGWNGRVRWRATHTHTHMCACTTRKTMGLLQNQPLAMLYCERLTCYMLHTPRCVLCVYMRATIGPLNTELTEWNEPHSLGREKWILFLTWRILYFYLQYRYIHFFAISPCRRCRHCRQSTIVCLMLDNTIIGIVATAKKKKQNYS